MKLMLDLQRIEKDAYQLQAGEQHQDFLPLLLQYIGDPQPELRDNLIYPMFYMWIKEENRFSGEELCSLLTVLTDENHLFYNIGSEEDQSVFTRTFSALPIALIVQRHRQNPFFTRAEIEQLMHTMLRYYKEEKDLRGYLSIGGWAHSVSHGADVFVELVQCEESSVAMLREVLVAISDKLDNGIHIFSDEDDERLVNIVDKMIDKALLPHQEITDWISSLAQCCNLPRSRSQVIARVNSKNFLRSLYFRRGKDSRGNELNTAILDTEVKLNRFSIS
ncbi:membrane protein [Lysinibacillus piscis]|uniref:Membrane protein n=2 Tax=Lysinibacillus piscis TaxID=2518931 RepID=A0ABQ5NMV2_9BACI|nr:membrane protein [Lysinibacillus sp. KH24]